jgi:hypothetical protein
MRKQQITARLVAGMILLAGNLAIGLPAAGAEAGVPSVNHGPSTTKPATTHQQQEVNHRKPLSNRPAQHIQEDGRRPEDRAGRPGADEVAALKEQMAVQQQQIEQLRMALEEQRQLLERALQAGQVSSNQVPNLGQVASVKPAVPASRAALPASALPIRALPTAQNPSTADTPPPDIELVKGELAAVADSAAQTNQRVTKLENDLKDTAKKSDGQGKQLGNFNFSGDLRMRYEPFFQDGNPTRQRERIRARLNINGKITDEVSGGISLATGSLDDPISTNQTMTGFFNRKQFSIDRAFITYKPKFFKELTLDAGKFKYPWYRTPLTFDNDVNPEGFAETLAFDLKSPGLKNFTIVGFELPFNELSGSYQKGADRPYALDPAKPAYDSFVFGGQLQMKFQLSDKAKLGLYAAGVNFNRSNPIALALVSGDLKPSLANSNSYSYAADGTTVTGYLYKFAYLDLIAQVDYQLTQKWPLTAFFNLVNNTRGPHGENRRGFWTEVMFGQTKNPKDMQFGYRFIYIGKDAVIGAFNESDLRSSTNVRDHVFLFAYQTHKNITLQWTDWYGHLKDPFLNTGLVPAGVRNNCTTAPFTGCRDPWLSRMQFDVVYKF